MKVADISIRRVADLLLSLLLSAAMLWYANQGIAAEQARGEHRNLFVLTAWAVFGLVGLLVSPTIRGRIVPSAQTLLVFYREGRRASDVKAVTVEVPPETKGV